MKKIGVIFYITFIYSITLSFAVNNQTIVEKQKKQNTENSSAFSSKISFQTCTAESSVTNFNNLSASSFKIQFNKFWAIRNLLESIIKTQFSQYQTFSRNFLIEYRKTDKIFPFQYFW